MSLTIDSGLGRPLARYGKREISVVTNSAEMAENGIEGKFELHLDPSQPIKFQHIPDKTRERDILYITGASGSGKSHYTVGYLKEYKRIYPKRHIYVLSALTEDETLDKIPGLKRIKINERLVSDPINPELFRDSIVVADDCDVIADKKQREAVLVIINAILETGRHWNTSLIMTNHLATNGKDTRRILNEAHSITFFPHSGSIHGITYLLERYVGMAKADFKIAKKSKSRWCTYFKHYPAVVMTEYDLWMPGREDD